MTPSPERYARASIALHWLMFLLFAGALAAIEYKGTLPKGSDARGQFTAIHMMLGQFILLFACVRVWARWRYQAPAESGPAWQVGSAKLVHLALYAIMFLMPISGILFVQAGGRDVAFLGWTLPRLVAENPDLKSTLKSAHEFVGNAVYFIVGLHVLGALWHQFVQRDNLMQRMR
ncbi:cytochrome b [uncultured Ralstonia sp.]|jgi:cytochrome b561|uniref:cytochrome b n=1 Tax=Ralstonia sp. TaxID=54061 RepID=UPI0025EEC4E3|nr:cytochrome b [uncultured Ralstonia sp.]